MGLGKFIINTIACSMSGWGTGWSGLDDSLDEHYYMREYQKTGFAENKPGDWGNHAENLNMKQPANWKPKYGGY